MELQEPKKLKRGLKELSPLFGTVPQMIVPQNRLRSETEILTVSIFHPDFPSDSTLSSSAFAKRINVAGYPSTLVSLRSADSNTNGRPQNRYAMNGHPLSIMAHGDAPVFSVKQHYLDWNQFDHLSRHSGTELGNKGLHSQVLLLDFDYRYMTYFKRIVPILDKWILHLTPKAESLNEAYKMLKVSAVINPHMEYYLLFDGATNDKRGERLFERFSEMVSRRLGLTICWLGNLGREQSGEKNSANLALENFFMKSVDRIDSLEKIALANFLQFALESPIGIAV
jgi:hypothetical protein